MTNLATTNGIVIRVALYRIMDSSRFVLVPESCEGQNLIPDPQSNHVFPHGSEASYNGQRGFIKDGDNWWPITCASSGVSTTSQVRFRSENHTVA